MLSLIKPTVKLETSYRGYIREPGDSERYLFILDFEFDDFSEFVVRLNNYSLGIGLPDGWVPHTTFWKGGVLPGNYFGERCRKRVCLAFPRCW